MKVIFVASGNKTVGKVSAFVQSQFESLQQEGLSMILFPVKGHGVGSYCASIFKLSKIVKQERPDIVHAHYSICGVVAVLATLFSDTKIVVSILGSFPKKSFKLLWVRFFVKRIWDVTIVKSKRTVSQIGIELPVIPNGVDLKKFVVINREEARKKCGFEEGKKYVIWCSNPSRPEKNYQLAKEAVDSMKDKNVCLIPVYNQVHESMVYYMCGADVLLLTSTNEGSPNVIKEALACNCPIVSTDVGDVREITDGVDGVYITKDNKVEDITDSLIKALSFDKRTKGREQLIKLGLSSIDIAHRIIKLYRTVIS